MSTQAAGKAKQQKGDVEYEASQATAKLGNLTASSSGAITKDHPDRSAGSWNQTVGSAKEFVGGATGSEVCTDTLPFPSHAARHTALTSLF